MAADEVNWIEVKSLALKQEHKFSREGSYETHELEDWQLNFFKVEDDYLVSYTHRTIFLYFLMYRLSTGTCDT
jgi:hypothetical protein